MSDKISRKIIFLDIDGTLNSKESMAEHGTCFTFGASCVAALNAIIAGCPGVEIVISSDWKYSHTLLELRIVLLQQGIIGAQVVDITPKWGETRGAEIRSWLNRQPKNTAFRFVALDDDSSGMKWMGKKFIKIDSTRGLQNEHIARALELLGG